jgi:CO dehydrogenase maturation factor
MKTLLTRGRGGTGKTSFVALMADYFIGKGETPLLLVDLDPDQNLGEMVGVDLEAEGRKTVAELLADTFIRKSGTTIGIPPSERIENRIWLDGLYEGKDFDLIAIGTKWVEGCYCMPDAALKSALERITKQYRYVLIDSPAGVEHLNRKVTAEVDDLFDILGPSSKSFAHLQRAKRIVDEVGIRYRNFYGVGGFLFPEHLEGNARAAPEIRYLGKIANDPLVTDRAVAGLSLLGLPPETPARRSVDAIMKAAGY